MEYEAVTLSKYTVELQDDHRHLREVSNPRLADTPFRSPQMTLIDISPHEWVLYWRTPSYTARRRPRVQGVEQLPLFDLPPLEKNIGAHEMQKEKQASARLRLVPKWSGEPDAKE